MKDQNDPLHKVHYVEHLDARLKMKSGIVKVPSNHNMLKGTAAAARNIIKNKFDKEGSPRSASNLKVDKAKIINDIIQDNSQINYQEAQKLFDEKIKQHKSDYKVDIKYEASKAKINFLTASLMVVYYCKTLKKYITESLPIKVSSYDSLRKKGIFSYQLLNMQDTAGYVLEGAELSSTQLQRTHDLGKKAIEITNSEIVKNGPKHYADNNPTSYAQFFHHTEQTLYRYLENYRKVEDLVETLIYRGLKKGDRIRAIYLDLYSTNSMCYSCIVGSMGTMSPESIFSKNLARAFKEKGIKYNVKHVPINMRAIIDKVMDKGTVKPDIKNFSPIPMPYTEYGKTGRHIYQLRGNSNNTPKGFDDPNYLPPKLTSQFYNHTVFVSSHIKSINFKTLSKCLIKQIKAEYKILLSDKSYLFLERKPFNIKCFNKLAKELYKKIHFNDEKLSVEQAVDELYNCIFKSNLNAAIKENEGVKFLHTNHFELSTILNLSNAKFNLLCSTPLNLIRYNNEKRNLILSLKVKDLEKLKNFDKILNNVKARDLVDLLECNSNKNYLEIVQQLNHKYIAKFIRHKYVSFSHLCHFAVCAKDLSIFNNNLFRTFIYKKSDFSTAYNLILQKYPCNKYKLLTILSKFWLGSYSSLVSKFVNFIYDFNKLMCLTSFNEIEKFKLRSEKELKCITDLAHKCASLYNSKEQIICASQVYNICEIYHLGYLSLLTYFLVKKEPSDLKNNNFENFCLIISMPSERILRSHLNANLNFDKIDVALYCNTLKEFNFEEKNCSDDIIMDFEKKYFVKLNIKKKLTNTFDV